MTKSQIIKKFLITVGLLSISIVVLAVQFNIEPGRRVGKIELGSTRQQTHKLLGKPDGSYRVSAKHTGDYWHSQSGNSVRIFYQNNSVVQIAVTSPSFTTADGLSPKSSLTETQAKFPKLTKTSYFVRRSGGGMIDYYDDVARGIAFIHTAPASDRPQYKPYAIVVHKPGVGVIPEKDEIEEKE